MAEALIRGIIAGERVAGSDLYVSDRREPRLDELHEQYGLNTTTSNPELAASADILVLAVKPQVLSSVLEEIRSSIKQGAVVISVAAGVHTQEIEQHLPSDTRVIRAMPNTPALVRAGATAITAGTHATEEDLALAKVLFDAVGITIVLDEPQLDAVTGLSGSGPAFVFLILEALADAGVKMGLARHNAQTLAAQTVMGSAKLLLETGKHPGELKDMVTSPGGTSIAGLHTLEQGGLRTTLMNAVECATERAKELGKTRS